MVGCCRPTTGGDCRPDGGLLSPNHRWRLPSSWISMPSWGIRWRRTRCLGGRRRRGLLNPAFNKMRRSVVRPMWMPSRSASNSARWVWFAPSYLVLAKRTRSAITASGVALDGLRSRWTWARAPAPYSRYATNMRRAWRVLTPINSAAWSNVTCSASRLLRTWSLLCSFGVNVTFSMV